jgi:hypothetical protein
MKHVSELIHRQSFLAGGETPTICNKGVPYAPGEEVLVLEARWRAFFSSAKPDDKIWQYKEPTRADGRASNPNLSKRGFVLLRDCRVIGQLSIEDIVITEKNKGLPGAP